jgi:AcrR family transcriptional regulator
MTAERSEPPAPAVSMVDVPGGTAFEDLTARARIRISALKHFAEDGYERATIRSIAQTAGVSPGLLRHHYGSKEALREACDSHVLEILRSVNARLLHDSSDAAATRQELKPFQRYLARALVDGSPTVGPIFDEMVTMTEEWIVRADGVRSDPPAVSRRIRAAVVTAMAAGIPLLHEHVSRALGTDMFAPVGDRMLALALLDIYSHRMISEDAASSAEAGFATSHSQPRP